MTTLGARVANVETGLAFSRWRTMSAALLAGWLTDAAAARTVTFAVAGGRTPQPILETLATMDVPWDRVDVVPTDDRRAPPDHPARNVGMIAAALPDARVRALEDVPADLVPDVVLLGFGDDAHVASVFPAGEGMGDAVTRKGTVRTTPSPLPAEAPFARITFTLPTLAHAASVLIAGRGEHKAQVLRDALAEHPPSSPLARVVALRGAAETTILIAES